MTDAEARDCSKRDCAPEALADKGALPSGDLLERAVEAHLRGRALLAKRLYEQLAAPGEGSARAFNGLAILRLQAGDMEAALVLFQRAAELAPDDEEVLSNLAVALRRASRLSEAAEVLMRLCKLHGRHRADLAAVQIALGDLAGAVATCKVGLSATPNDFACWINLGGALQRLGRLEPAVAAYRRALEIRTEAPEALCNLSSVLDRLGKPYEAVEMARRALLASPDYVEALCNLAAALLSLGREEEAEAAARRALSLAPRFERAASILGNVHFARGRLDDAIKAHRSAIRQNSDFAEAHFNLSVALLAQGIFEEGWEEYEWRHLLGDGVARCLPRQMNIGSLKEGATVVIEAEQGLGDLIQFARYVPSAARRWGSVVLRAPAEMHRLLKTLPGEIVLRDWAQAEQGESAPIPLMSLPRLFETRVETIPKAVPYLEAEVERVARWRRQLNGDLFRVGIVWQGNPRNSADSGRSVPLSAFEALARLPNVELVSLQRVHGLEQLRALASSMHVRVLDDFDLPPHAFLDTAAVMMSLDLVVTVDTAVAHLAGALGRPVWILLKEVPDWRWMLDQKNTPWYPSARLFRRSPGSTWYGLMEEVANEISALLGGGEAR